MKLRQFDHTAWTFRRSASAPGLSVRAGGPSTTASRRPPSNEALDRGVTFIDTADVYGDGHSERLIGKVLAERKGPRPFVATKAGAPLRSLGPAGYDRAHLLPSIEREPPQPPHRHARPASAPLPAVRRLLHTRGVRRARRHRQGRQDPELRRQRRAHRGRDQGDRVPWRQKRADHLQHVPPAPGRAVLQARGGAERRDHRPRAAGKRPAHRQVQARHPFRGERPSRVQSPRRVLRRRRDLLGRALRGRNCRGRGDPVAAAAGHDDGPVRAPLDPDVPRGDDSHSRRQDAGAGPRQCRGERPAADRQGDHGEAAGPSTTGRSSSSSTSAGSTVSLPGAPADLGRLAELLASARYWGPSERPASRPA